MADQTPTELFLKQTHIIKCSGATLTALMQILSAAHKVHEGNVSPIDIKESLAAVPAQYSDIALVGIDKIMRESGIDPAKALIAKL